MNKRALYFACLQHPISVLLKYTCGWIFIGQRQCLKVTITIMNAHTKLLHSEHKISHVLFKKEIEVNFNQTPLFMTAAKYNPMKYLKPIGNIETHQTL